VVRSLVGALVLAAGAWPAGRVRALERRVHHERLLLLLLVVVVLRLLVVVLLLRLMLRSLLLHAPVAMVPAPPHGRRGCMGARTRLLHGRAMQAPLVRASASSSSSAPQSNPADGVGVQEAAAGSVGAGASQEVLADLPLHGWRALHEATARTTHSQVITILSTPCTGS
jgi:hypothetical protein